MERKMNRTQDDLDNLLGAFFRAEMPHPWPAPLRRKAVPAPVPVRDAGAWVASSKFALAASLGLLLAGGWMLSGKLGSPAVPDTFRMGPGSAGKGVLPPMPKEEKPLVPDDMLLPPGQ